MKYESSLVQGPTQILIMLMKKPRRLYLFFNMAINNTSYAYIILS